MPETPDGQEKTEPATQKRLYEARMRGQVSKSIDITTASILLFGGLAIYILGTNLINNHRNFMQYLFHNLTLFDITTSESIQIYNKLIFFLATSLLPILIAVFIIAFISEVSQVGLKIATKKFTEGLMFKQVFNPLKGLRRIFFSGRSIFELVKSLIKVFLLGLVVYWVLSSRSEEAIKLMEMPFSDIAVFMVSVSFELLYKVAGFYIFIAVIDHFYQKYRFKEDMKMTKQEVKEEYKQAEGDPKIKARLRQLMRQRMRKFMLKKVSQADVVVTNPTHYAVALEYKPPKNSAPIVTAKGVDYLAEQIKEIAKANDVPIVEEAPLARTLYYAVDIGKEIPEKLFKAVAQILAYVYKLKRKNINYNSK